MKTKTYGLNDSEAYEIVRNLEEGLSVFDAENKKFVYQDPQSAEALNSPSAMINLLEDDSREGMAMKLAQIYHAVKQMHLIPYGLPKDNVQKAEKIGKKTFLGSLPLGKRQKLSLGYYKNRHYQIAPNLLGKLRRKDRVGKTEILEIFNESILPNISEYSSISAVVRKVQNLAEKRYGALYHHFKNPHGKKGFSKEAVRPVIAHLLKMHKMPLK